MSVRDLPPLFSFEQFERDTRGLSAHERLTAFVALPLWKQAEAHLALRERIDWFRCDDLDGSAADDGWGVAA